MAIAGGLVNGSSGEGRVRRLVLFGITGSYLLPSLEIAVLQDGHGLAVKLEPQSARLLAEQLVRLADARDPEAPT